MKRQRFPRSSDIESFLGKPWDRPRGGPNRQGDATDEPIYRAIGRVLSNWEGVEVALLVLCSALCEDGESPQAEISHLQNVFQIERRAVSVLDAADKFIESTHLLSEQAQELRNEIESILSAYVGWSGRRNDVAHGAVTPMQSQDYLNGSCETVTSYSLCPSHSNKSKWPHGEPVYNMNSSEIEDIAAEISRLDAAIEDLSARIRKIWAGANAVGGAGML